MGLPKTIPACDLVRFKFIVSLHSNSSSSMGLSARRKDICELSESPFTFFYLSSAGRLATLGNTLTGSLFQEALSELFSACYFCRFFQCQQKNYESTWRCFLGGVTHIFFQAANMMRPDWESVGWRCSRCCCLSVLRGCRGAPPSKLLGSSPESNSNLRNHE